MSNLDAQLEQSDQSTVATVVESLVQTSVSGLFLPLG